MKRDNSGCERRRNYRSASQPKRTRMHLHAQPETSAAYQSGNHLQERDTGCRRRRVPQLARYLAACATVCGSSRQILDAKGHEQELKLKDFDARVVQHEVDHLEGVLIVDYPHPKLTTPAL